MEEIGCIWAWKQWNGRDWLHMGLLLHYQVSVEARETVLCL